MDRDNLTRMLLVMVLGVGIFLGWQYFFGPKQEPRPAPPTAPVVPAQPVKPADGSGTGEIKTGVAAATAGEYVVVSSPPENVATYQGPALGEATYLGPYAMAVELTGQGAGVERITLSDYFASVADRDLPAAQRKKLELVRKGVGRPGFVLTRLDVTARKTGVKEIIRLDLPPSRPLADLNGGRGVRPGHIIVGDGVVSVSIDLSTAKTVGDVLKAINNNGVVTVLAAVDPARDRLTLGGLAGSRLSVREVDGGSTAADLGILQAEVLPENVPVVGKSLMADPWWTYDAQWSKEHQDEARFRLEVLRGDGSFLTLTKTIRLARRTLSGDQAGWDRRFDTPEAFAPRMTMSFVDHSGTLASVVYTMRGPEGLVSEETRGDARKAAAGFAAGKGAAEFKTADDAFAENKRVFKPGLDWAGLVDKYFAVAAVADPLDPGDRFAYAQVYWAYTEKTTDVPGVLMFSLDKPFDSAEKGAEVRANYLLFAGPTDSELLNKPVLAGRGLVDLVKWASSCCCFSVPVVDSAIGGLSKYMVLAIDWIADFVLNKGIAVIILVILVRLIMFPISRFSQISMLKMQDLQPDLVKVKELYKDDKQKQQLETMKVMRERGVNPMMGCVPMLLQLPIWIALYSGIAVAISLRQAPFFWWISDLARPDAMFAIPETQVFLLSWLGNWAQWQFNLLPLLTVVAFYVQMKFQPQATGGSPEMERQQKMMKWMMPGMMLVFFYTAPSALNLYIMTSSAIGYFEQKLIRRQYQQMKLRPPKPRKEKPKGRIALWMENRMESARKLQEQAKKSDNPWESKKKRK